MQIPENDLNTPIGRLREFIVNNINGQCKIISEGSECKCALCDLDRTQEALQWYGKEAFAILENLVKKNDMAVLASVTVLELDAGKRAKDILGDK